MLAIGRPFGRPAILVPLIGLLSELFWLAAFRSDYVNVLVLVEIRNVSDPLAIGRPANAMLGALVVGHSRGRAASGGNRPYVYLAGAAARQESDAFVIGRPLCLVSFG